MSRKGLLVLGMHRSGTSVLTGTLHRMGMHLSANLLTPDQNNETGYWESRDINTLMERLLRAAGSRWHDWRPLDLSAVPPAVLQEIRAALLSVVARESRGALLYGVKDPRICRAAPLWLELLRETGSEPVAVLVLRHPISVACSLAKRDGMPADKALLLWLRHMLDAERDTRSISRVFIGYDDLLENPAAAIDRIASALGISWPRPFLAAAAEIQEFVRHDLRHHVSEGDLMMASGVPWFERAWSLFQASLRGDTRLDDRFDELADDFSAGIRPFQNYFGLIEDSLERAEQRVAQSANAVNRAYWLLGSAVLESGTTPGRLVDKALAEHQEQLSSIMVRLSALESAPAAALRSSSTDDDKPSAAPEE